jgi:hypothetical protein
MGCTVSKIKTSSLIGPALDWAVAKGESVYMPRKDTEANRAMWFLSHWETKQGGMNYSTKWAQGGPIIEREKLSTSYSIEGDWMGYYTIDFDMRDVVRGPTPLIAAMRCYVKNKLGDEVDVPDELLLRSEPTDADLLTALGPCSK